MNMILVALQSEQQEAMLSRGVMWGLSQLASHYEVFGHEVWIMKNSQSRNLELQDFKTQKLLFKSWIVYVKLKILHQNLDLFIKNA